MIRRIKYAFQMFWLAFKKPEIFQTGLFQMVESMTKFFNDVKESQSPRYAKMGIKPIAKINYEGTHLLSLWCGYAEKDNPIERIRELAEENYELRIRLAEMLNVEQDVQECDATQA